MTGSISWPLLALAGFLTVMVGIGVWVAFIEGEEGAGF
jgi:hypothetical protein